jgi:hypothetical protein
VPLIASDVLLMASSGTPFDQWMRRHWSLRRLLKQLDFD